MTFFQKKIAMIKDFKGILFGLFLIILSLSILIHQNKKSQIEEDQNKPSIQSMNKSPEEKTEDTKIIPIVRFNDIEINAQLTREEVLAKWGKPYDPCSGLECFLYELEDGRHIMLSFSGGEPYYLLRATIFADWKDSEVIFEKN